MNPDFFSSYFNLRSRLDINIQSLEALHSSHMKCTKACSHCCMNFGVLPIEAYAIAQVIQGKTAKPVADEHTDNCRFLQDSLCSIYSNRPFICRTQGLPIVYLIDEQYELSACNINFTTCNDSFFTQENCLFMDSYNSELYRLNIDFIEKNPHLQLQEQSLISVNEICSL